MDEATPKRITNPTQEDLAKVHAHPLRLAILAQLEGDDTRGSPNQIAELLGESVSLVAYHVRVLDHYDCIRLVDTKQRGGATEHFYCSTGRIRIVDRDGLDAEQRALIVQLVDEFASKNGFDPRQRGRLQDARNVLASPA